MSVNLKTESTTSVPVVKENKIRKAIKSLRKIFSKNVAGAHSTPSLHNEIPPLEQLPSAPVLLKRTRKQRLPRVYTEPKMRKVTDDFHPDLFSPKMKWALQDKTFNSDLARSWDTMALKPHTQRMFYTVDQSS